MKRAYYSDSIQAFLLKSTHEIIGKIVSGSEFSDDPNQKNAWAFEFDFLKEKLQGREGAIFFEYAIPRMGKRIDVLLVLDSVIFILEFKVGEKRFGSYALDQVWDYALDLKNFHETSHDKVIAPILIANKAKPSINLISLSRSDDHVFKPIKTNGEDLNEVLDNILLFSKCEDVIDIEGWEDGRYCPTPTIIEAAKVLYSKHSVESISRSDASAVNLKVTSKEIDRIIKESKENNRKSICFVTGVPGAGKTLVGLDIATKYFEKEDDLYSVFLSGNGPLVKVLQEALARDKVAQLKQEGKKATLGEARSEVKAFIQNVHHFRDDGTKDDRAPVEHVALFDEAQRAWTKHQTVKFMRQKKGLENFDYSEPEFLISCIDRHEDWGVVVCLVGGGQEINTGEAGINEWIEAIEKSFPAWNVYISNRLIDSEYACDDLENRMKRNDVKFLDSLHLSVSMRSFRAENVSLFIKQVLDIDFDGASETLGKLNEKYPIVLTRDLNKAKKWLKEKARGTERYGMVVSSQAQRLRPYAIDVRYSIDPVHYFLDDKDDIRSSYYLEDVATEFHIQGLELDWVCVTWDADLRFSDTGWNYKSFRGKKWTNINKEERQVYLKNAYRVLLTRARQGMIIVIPEGNQEDPTRLPEFYNPTFEYLKSIGIKVIE